MGKHRVLRSLLVTCKWNFRFYHLLSLICQLYLYDDIIIELILLREITYFFKNITLRTSL